MPGKYPEATNYTWLDAYEAQGHIKVQDMTVNQIEAVCIELGWDMHSARVVAAQTPEGWPVVRLYPSIRAAQAGA